MPNILAHIHTSSYEKNNLQTTHKNFRKYLHLFSRVQEVLSKIRYGWHKWKKKGGTLALHIGRLQTDEEEWIRKLQVDTDQKAWIGKVNMSFREKKSYNETISILSALWYMTLNYVRQDIVTLCFIPFPSPVLSPFTILHHKSEHLKSFHMKAFGWSEDSEIFQTTSKCRHI